MKYLILIFTFTVSACGGSLGTGTGNPLGPGNNASSPDQQPQSQQIFITACRILEKCNPGMTDAICGNGIANLTGFSPKLGVPVSPPPTAVQILQLEEHSKLTPDSVQTDKCIAQMLKLSCTDSSVVNAYVPNAASAFQNAPDMLDPVCARVFSP